MESKFRLNTNGERSTAETPATAFRRGEPNQPQMQSSSSSSSQFQSDSQRSDEQFLNYPNHDLDLGTLNSSFGNLSFSDSSVRQNGNPLNHNLYNQPINGGAGAVRGGGGGGFLFPPPPPPMSYQLELELLRMSKLQELSYQNDSVNGNRSYGYDPSGGSIYNNGFLNGNSRDVPFPSRNQNPWEDMNGGFGYGTNGSMWNNNGGFSYNQDPSSSMENERSSLLFCAKDRVSCPQLKKRIIESSKETFDMIFNELIVHVCELMVDPFGHDVWNHMFPKCSKEQITMIADMITRHQYQFINICFDSLGTRALQFLLVFIAKVSEDLIMRMVDTITIIALQLSRSNNGKHVILGCFKVFRLSHYRNLLEVIAQNCYQIAIDQHGCCLLQQALQLDRNPDPNQEAVQPDREELRLRALKKIDRAQLRQRLIQEIIANALKLCLNCYGNYVVQYIVEMDNRNVIELLVRQLLGNYGYLSRNKYGSHAVQKLLKIRNLDTRMIVHDLLIDIDTLLLDPFGNYVIQTAWLVSKDDMRSVLRWHIENNIRLMRCSKYGKKILEKLNL
ncbi:putative pumilio [Cardamine amara subsp. amara]|uniref:Pumilio n=1 Tax=Cardamine amara subsp. amara TaxID=228776 RepID=A0ABD1AMH2_CARAN